MKNTVQFQFIDMETYPRRAHFEYFTKLQYPYVGVTVNVDIAEILKYSRRHRRSFYLTFLHAAALAANRIPQLRQRIRGNRIVEYSECPTSHIEQTDAHAYCYCTLRHHMSEADYFAQAEAARQACKTRGIREDEDVESMIFISTVPWLHYTAMIQPVAGGDESNPRITWGKYTESADGSALMPVSILAHHALVDGIHIARFYDALEAEIGRYAAL